MDTTISEKVRNCYRGAEGSRYHQNTHGRGQYVSEVVAHRRKHKIQPFISPQDVVFEFGAGTGYNLRYLQCQRRIAYDLSDIGREIFEKAGIEFTTDLDFLPANCADVVICHHVLEHVPDPLDTLATISKYLKPGGRLLLFVPFETQRCYRKYHPGDKNNHLFSWNALTLGNLMVAAGYAIDRIAIKPFGYEQRLAPLAKFSWFAYSAALWFAQKLLPVEELLAVATKPGS